MLYLLDVATQELRHITADRDDLTMQAALFSPSGQTILVFWEDNETRRCDVHICSSGDRVATFYPPWVSIGMSSVAFLTGDRLAVAAHSSFQVYKPRGYQRATQHHRVSQFFTMRGLLALSLSMQRAPRWRSCPHAAQRCSCTMLTQLPHWAQCSWPMHCYQSARPAPWSGECMSGSFQTARTTTGIGA